MNRWCFTRDVGFMEDQEGPWVRFEEIKPQLTLEELRDQFEKEYSKDQYRYKYKLKNKDSKGLYNSPYIRGLWKFYIKCAKANNVLREG